MSTSPDTATNGDGDTGRFPMLREWEQDCDAAPQPQVYQPAEPRPVLADVMRELHIKNPYSHGYAGQIMLAHWCACCDKWQHMGPIACPECGAPWERVA